MTTTFAPTIDTALAIAREAHAAGRVDDAAAAMESALRASPRDPDGIRALAMLRLDQGRTAEAVKLLGIVAQVTNRPDAFSEYLFYGLHDGTATPELHRQYAIRAEPGVAIPKTYDGRRPLRVGYLSGHLRAHTVTRFLLPVLQGHSDAVEVFGYHDGPTDAVTARVRPLCRHWRETMGMSDADLYRGIRGDRLDVLIDLDGHLAAGRRQQVVMALPAPVVAGYIGYPADTHPGIRRVTDRTIDPDPCTSPYAIRLPGCCYAFEPRDFPPSPAPAERNGYVTFGSLNRACKLSPAVARAWAEILRCAQDARLIVLAPSGEQNGSVRRLLESAGVDGARLTLDAGGDAAAFNDLLGRVDVMLDTFPWYSGMTTTADALTAGLPVVTLAGTTPASRVSASLLAAAVLPEFIAATEEDYVRIAAGAARSAFLGPTRDRVRRQAMVMLTDGGRVARALEEKLMRLATV